MRVERDGASLVVQLYGELDVANSVTFERRLRVAQRHGDRVIVDLSGLHFIDMGGLRVLVRAHERAPDGWLMLFRGPRAVHRAFELTGLDRELPFAN